MTLQVVVGSHCSKHVRTSPIGTKNVPATQSLERKVRESFRVITNHYVWLEWRSLLSPCGSLKLGEGEGGGGGVRGEGGGGGRGKGEGGRG